MHELTSLRLPLDSHRYRSAFLLCRRHRIDLNILHDHDPEAFKAHLSDFVTQVKDVDHLNLFLSGLKDEDVTKTMYRPLVASVKDLFVALLPRSVFRTSQAYVVSLCSAQRHVQQGQYDL